MPPWGIVGLIVWAYVHTQMNPQRCTKFGANRSSRLTASRDFLNVWPPNPPLPRHAPWGIEGWLVFSLCPFPDESADVNQSWCQSVQPFDSFPCLLNIWPHNPPPHVPSCVSQGNLFGIYPFPDESAHVYQIWCQLDQPFDIFPWLLNVWPPNPPPNVKGELYLAYVYSQTNPQTCTKFGANRSSRLTAASQYFWICDPLKTSRNAPLCLEVQWGWGFSLLSVRGRCRRWDRNIGASTKHWHFFLVRWTLFRIKLCE